jgi:mutator protein MutT
MREANFYSAVFWIIKNENWEILFQKRQNSGFMDGKFQLPSGHIENTETMKGAFIREMEEELGIILQEEDLELLHISHRVRSERMYFDIYFEVKNYKWEIQNREPHKCSELQYRDIENGDTKEIVDFNLEVLKKIKNKIAFWEQKQ